MARQDFDLVEHPSTSPFQQQLIELQLKIARLEEQVKGAIISLDAARKAFESYRELGAERRHSLFEKQMNFVSRNEMYTLMALAITISTIIFKIFH